MSGARSEPESKARYEFAGGPKMLVALLASAALGACSLGLGDRCASNQPCAPDLVCAYPRPDAGVGVCDYAPKEFGSPCAAAADCASDLTCSNHFTLGERYGTCV